ncbi:hypothetical protein UFOVP1596_41 [uncultured Caudovirales phage]|uniref:Uncharacterized protein n=1 Tax=uncultured Caudovirales phage TaxID=2100421 RepID=A0A6J5SUM7_9CAUD|nr:hypothetical protein UFOVP1596_41 [uncultured Caudovirales phage]
MSKLKIVEKSDPEKNKKWQENQILIRDAILSFLKLNVRAPTLKELAEETKLSVNTIHKHYATIKFESTNNPLRALTPDVIASIAVSARKGSSASQKLWMQLMEGWVEKQDLNVSNKTINVTGADE